MRPHRRTAAHPLHGRTTAISAGAAVLLVLTLVLLALQSSDRSSASPPGTLPQVAAHSDEGDASSWSDDGAGRKSGEDAPLSELDRTFLIQVRQANLWEAPAGDLAETHASSVAVKRAGRHLVEGHTRLDQLVREDAEQLGVALPDEPSAEQQRLLTRLKEAEGKKFDRLFAEVLRLSHGKIFPVIAQVRVATQNDTVRRFAIEANQAVLDHLRVIDDTGLVKDSTIREIGEAVLPE